MLAVKVKNVSTNDFLFENKNQRYRYVVSIYFLSSIYISYHLFSNIRNTYILNLHYAIKILGTKIVILTMNLEKKFYLIGL